MMSRNSATACRPALALVVLAVVLAACQIPRAGPEEPRAPVCATGQIDGDPVQVLSRTDHIPPVVIEQFERRYGVVVEQHVYESEADLLLQVTAPVTGFDVVLAADHLAETLWRGEQLFPLDLVALPGLANLDPQFYPPSDGTEDRHSVPFLWGTIGLGLNLNVVGQDVEPTWQLVFDIDRVWSYAGRISMPEEERQVMAAAMLYLGHPPNLADPEAVNDAAQVAAMASAHLRGFDSKDYGVGLVEGALDVAHGRSDVIVRELPTESTDFRYVIPREGAAAWIDTMAVPNTSRYPCTAHSFIEFLLDPSISAEVANHARVATPNLAAMAFVLPELAANPDIYPPPEARSRIHLLEYSEELNRLYTEAFIEALP